MTPALRLVMRAGLPGSDFPLLLRTSIYEFWRFDALLQRLASGAVDGAAIAQGAVLGALWDRAAVTALLENVRDGRSVRPSMTTCHLAANASGLAWTACDEAAAVVYSVRDARVPGENDVDKTRERPGTVRVVLAWNALFTRFYLGEFGSNASAVRRPGRQPLP